MVSFPGYTIVSGTKFRIHYNITITFNFRQQVARLSSHILCNAQLLVDDVLVCLSVVGRQRPSVCMVEDGSAAINELGVDAGDGTWYEQSCRTNHSRCLIDLVYHIVIYILSSKFCRSLKLSLVCGRQWNMTPICG